MVPGVRPAKEEGKLAPGEEGGPGEEGPSIPSVINWSTRSMVCSCVVFGTMCCVQEDWDIFLSHAENTSSSYPA